MPIFTALPSSDVIGFRNGAPDAHGNPPEKATSDGAGNPCRHCLQNIPKNAPMLILAYKPFVGTHPYAEIGPIFLCADDCAHGSDTETPDILTTSPDYLLKGYSKDDRIVYGTGAVTPAPDIDAKLTELFARPDVAYVHARSARNNCYQCRIDRDT